MSEDADVGQSVAMIGASDADATSKPLTFFVSQGDPTVHFLIRSNGEVRVRSKEIRIKINAL